MKQVIKAVTPPIAIWSARALVRRLGAPALTSGDAQLFNGDDEMFKSALKETTLYGEYGCGASTKWVLNHSSAVVRAVDTSRQWIDAVQQDLLPSHANRAAFQHVDLGPLSNWGRPMSYAHRDRFSDYTDWIWQTDKTPDTVLIDGRFRVGCFLASLKFADAGTRLIFDDYINRPIYHVVEDFADRAEVCGRQCLFIAPGRDALDIAAVDQEIANFRHVMD